MFSISCSYKETETQTLEPPKPHSPPAPLILTPDGAELGSEPWIWCSELQLSLISAGWVFRHRSVLGRGGHHVFLYP